VTSVASRYRLVLIESVCALLILSVLAGCASRADLTSFVSTRSWLEAPAPVGSSGPHFGIGLAGDAQLWEGSKLREHQYCQEAGQTFKTCPPYDLGDGSAHFRFDAMATDGTSSVVQSGRTTAGKFDFAQTNAATPRNEPNVYSSSTANEAWTDTLHVTSKRLPPGWPANILVSLVVDPSAVKISCLSNPGLYSGYFKFVGTGEDPYGYPVELLGECEYSQGFVYYVGDFSATGKIDTGVISTSVGAAVPVGMSGTVFTTACEEGYCPGPMTTTFAGSLEWKITGITKDVDYTSDSGRRYGL
jgi:hypothetical protein